MYKLVNSEDVRPKPHEYYIEKAMKLKALLDSDQEGERESATKLLADFMDKYDITWKELDDTIEKDYDLPCKNDFHRRLLIQVVYKNIGGGHCYRMFNGDTNEEYSILRVKCRPVDFINIYLDWEFYWTKFEEELDIFYRAFVERNQLFPPKELQKENDDNDNDDLSEDEIRKIRGMMSGIDTYSRSKHLESPKEVTHSEESSPN